MEIKNIGSISNVKLSIEKEITRQEKLYDKGEKLEPQTRRFDDKLQDTILMRIKETGNDYRYFPEPDIPYITLTEEMISSAIQTLPMMPDERRKLYLSLGVSPINIEKMIANRSLSDYLNTFIGTTLDFKEATNLLLGDIKAYLNQNEKEIFDTDLTKEKFIDLIEKLKSNTLTSKNLKDILVPILESDQSIEDIMKKYGISNITDRNLLEEIVSKVIENNKESVEDYKSGKDRAVKYLMGQIMKETKGSANPKLVNEILIQQLNQ